MLNKDHILCLLVLFSFISISSLAAVETGGSSEQVQRAEQHFSGEKLQMLERAKELSEESSMFFDQGNYPQSIEKMKKVLNIHRTILGVEHSETVANMEKLAALHQLSGEYSYARALYKEVLELKSKLLGSKHLDTVKCMDNLAFIYQALGEYIAAKLLFEESLNLKKELLGSDDPDTIITMNNLAYIHLILGDYAAAKSLYVDALKIRKKNLGKEHVKTAQSMENLAAVHEALGNYTSAIPLYKQSLSIKEQLLGVNNLKIVSSKNNLAAAYQTSKNFSAAEELYTQVLNIRENLSGDRLPETLQSVDNLADVYVSQEKYDDAKTLYERSLANRKSIYGKQQTETLVSITNLAEIALSQKNWLEAYQYTSQLLSFYQKAIDPIKQLTAGNTKTERDYQQTQFYRMRLHLKACQHLLLDHQTSDKEIILSAFTAIQLAHDPRDTQTMIFNTLKLAGEDQLRQSQIDALRMALNKRDKSIENFNSSLLPSKQNTDEKQANLKKAMQKAQSAVPIALATLKKDWPMFDKLIDPAPLTLDDAHALLLPHEALLTYITSEDETYLMVIRKDKSPSLHALDINRNQLHTDIGKLRTGITPNYAEGSQAANIPTYNLKLANNLFNTILKPVTKELEGITHLITISEGPLVNLPFAALVTREHLGKRRAYQEVRWLIKDYSLSQLPSLTSLRMVRWHNHNKRANEAYLGFGDPSLTDKGAVFKAGSINLQFASRSSNTLKTTNELKDLSSLPSAGAELNALATKLNVDQKTRVFLRDNATETQFKMLNETGVLKKQRVLAFATHALHPDSKQYQNFQSGVESGLVLTPPSTSTAKDDGFLTVSEISHLNLNADWVLLSACSTGKIINQASSTNPAMPAQSISGLSTLSKSFFYAGSRQLLVTQWDTFDPSSHQLVSELFDQNKNRRTSKSQRLQQAMVKLIDVGLEANNGCNTNNEDLGLTTKVSCYIKNKLFTEKQKINNWAHPIYWAPYVIIGDGV